MIGILEQTYGRHDHASVNAALIQAIALAMPDEDITFASSAEHLGHVEQFRTLPARVQHMDIVVRAPGGVSASRLFAQWRAIRAVMRRARPRIVVALSSGPETFFAARLIVGEFPSVVVFIVLHGNLNDAIGWRSRDPRRRWFDYRSGLAVSRHRRIRLVLLEDYILPAAIRKHLVSKETTVVWPLSFDEREVAPLTTMRPDAAPIRIAFIGAATKNKGFDKFLELVRCAGPRVHDFQFIGSLHDEFPDSGLEMSSEPLTRKEYIRRLRDIDYVFLPYPESTYAFTASGSLLDCVSQRKPVISLDFAGVRELSAKWGDIGFICQSMEQVRDLLSQKAILSNPAEYARFQSNLAAICASRTPAGIAVSIRRDLMSIGTGARAG